MDAFKKILVPVDLSDRCRPAVNLATNLARCNNAKIVFCYVGLPPLPPEAMYAQSEMDELLEAEKAQFRDIVPTHPDVAFGHEFLRGNPGPEIVNFAETGEFDVVVVGTHGRTGIMRWVLGSVAEYVIRNAGCPVISVKLPHGMALEDSPLAAEPAAAESSEEPAAETNAAPETEAAPKNENEPENQKPSVLFVTSCMAHAIPIRDFDEMPKVIRELVAARVSAAPVVDGEGNCVGILTETDVEKYLDLWRRMDEHDESALDEIYETDSYGLRRISNTSFHSVKRHMTSPVITISNDATCQDAEKMFAENTKIHHLVVVADKQPVGILEADNLNPPEKWDINTKVSM